MDHTTARSTLVPGLLLLLGLLPLGCGEPEAPAASSPEPAEAAETGGADQLLRVLDDPDFFSRAARLAELAPTLGEEVIPEIRKQLARYLPGRGVVEFDLMMRRWADLRPEDAADWALDESPLLYRQTAIRTSFTALARSEPSKVIPMLTWAYLQDRETGKLAQAALVEGWFEKDRAEALEYIESLVQDIPRQRSIHAYITTLAATDGTDAAIRWVESLPEDDSPFKREAFEQLIWALVWVDPAAATRFCDDHCDGPHGGNLRRTLVRTRMNQGDAPEEVIAWVTDTLDGEQRASLLSMAFGIWAGVDHDAAIQWMEEKLAEPEPEPWLSELYGDYAWQIAPEDPARALEWLVKLEEETGRGKLGMERVARYWLSRDEEAAEAWLSQSPLDEAERERARNLRLPHYLPRVADPNSPVQ